MKFYEAYISTNGTLMVKTVPDCVKNIVDQKSPYVLKYLGKKMLPSKNQANAFFKEQNGGKLYIDQDEIEKLLKDKKKNDNIN